MTDNTSIHRLLDEAFEGVTMTPDLKDLKEELRGNLASRVSELEAKGTDAAAAATTAVAELGDIRELIAGVDAEGSTRPRTTAADAAAAAARNRVKPRPWYVVRTVLISLVIAASATVVVLGAIALLPLPLAIGAAIVFGLAVGAVTDDSLRQETSTHYRTSSARAAIVAGFDVAKHPEKVRRAIGFVAQKPVSDPMDTGRENLVLAGELQGMSGPAAKTRAAELLERFSLTNAANRQVKTYSGGMARKLDVAIGLMHHPQVLFLDEPTTGLDPEARAEMWAELEAMARDERMTVLLTTHYLEEADRLASRLAIVDHGRVVAEGTPEELKNDLHGDAVFVELAAQTDAAQALAAVSGVLHEVLLDGRVIRGRADVGSVALPRVLAALDEKRLRVASATVARPSLDDVYLRHTGHTLEGTKA